MSILQAVRMDLEKDPIWNWTKTQVSELASTFNSETKDYILILNESAKRAYIQDLEEFVKDSEAEMLFHVIRNQFEIRARQIVEEDLRNQEIRGLELFPNVDLNRHIGDDIISRRLPIGSGARKLAEKAEAMTLLDWQKLALERNWKGT